MKIEGIEQAMAKLRALDAKVQKQHLKTALKAGAEVTKNEVIADAPSRSGTLRSEVKVRVGGVRKGIVSVAVAVGQKVTGGRAWYAGFVNAGHFLGKRLHGVKGRNAKADYHRLSLEAGRKFVPGKHFLERAADNTHDRAIQVTEEKLVELLNEENGQV